eukprot:4969346-Alexandrium_andersonii.AAC.1
MVSLPACAPVLQPSVLRPSAEVAAEREGVRSDLGLPLGSECCRLLWRARLPLLLDARRGRRPRAARVREVDGDRGLRRRDRE